MPLEHAILALIEFEPMSGYDRKKFFDQSVAHFWSATQSHIYKSLDGLGKQGWAELHVVQRDGKPNRKVYQITEAGHAELRHWLVTPLPMDPVREASLIQIFFSHFSANAEIAALFEARINQAIRAVPAYQSPASVFIANLVDLHSVPKLFRGIAERAMRESYEKAALGLPSTEKPQDFIVILPDWDGSLTKALGLKDTGKIAALAVLDAHGNLIGTYQGSEPERQALALLQQIA